MCEEVKIFGGDVVVDVFFLLSGIGVDILCVKLDEWYVLMLVVFVE